MNELKVSSQATKEQKYQELVPQVKELIGFETDWVANTANLAAVLKETFKHHWVGFYFVKDTQLVLGPFQGPVACTRIDFGKGVCGTSWRQGKTVIVKDVEEFPGHIACSPFSKSEIVVPLYNGSRQIVAVLDIDSDQIGTFDETDQLYLETLCRMIPVSQKEVTRIEGIEL